MPCQILQPEKNHVPRQKNIKVSFVHAFSCSRTSLVVSILYAKVVGLLNLWSYIVFDCHTVTSLPCCFSVRYKASKSLGRKYGRSL